MGCMYVQGIDVRNHNKNDITANLFLFYENYIYLQVYYGDKVLDGKRFFFFLWWAKSWEKNSNNKIPLADYHLQGATTNLFKRV